MNSHEFDKFADEYSTSLRASIEMSGEGPAYFAEYKVRDVVDVTRQRGLRVRTVLDFGCGIGGATPYFSKLIPDAKLFGADVSKKSLDIARERCGTLATYCEFDGRKLPFSDGEFDVVFAACVFHHIPESEHVRLLSEIRRVLSPVGVFLIFEHNPLNPLTRRVVNQCPFDENAILIRAPEMKRRLQAAGFPLVETRYRIFFPHILKGLRAMEPGLVWCPLGAQYSLSAQK